MLIVNADDLGRSREETNVVLKCYERGRVSTTSAMVFMADSERAATLAQDAGIPVGLHLNLSEAFTGGHAPADLQRRHDSVCRFLRLSRYALALFNPLRVADFEAVVQAQFAEFRRLYNAEPAHVDGHQHMHLAANVLCQKLLPDGARVRRNFSFQAGEKGAINRWYRARVDRSLARRHRLTDYFFSLSRQMHVGGLGEVMELSRAADVELMIHPAWPHEYELLMSEEFGRALNNLGVQAGRLSS
jgi:predicted glycoside hydrolase/deacetylase ChbG (UPF0249 family)